MRNFPPHLGISSVSKIFIAVTIPNGVAQRQGANSDGYSLGEQDCFALVLHV